LHLIAGYDGKRVPLATRFQGNQSEVVNFNQETLGDNPHREFSSRPLYPGKLTFQRDQFSGSSSAEMHKGMELGGANPADIAAFDRAYKIGGIRGVWRWQITRFNERATRRDAGLVDTAGHYAMLGEKDKAFESLEGACQRHIQGLAFVQCTPNLDSLRSDPRFQDLLRRLNFPP
jgi:hypothetical protein